MHLEARLENWGEVLRYRKAVRRVTMKTKWKGSRFAAEPGAPTAPPTLNYADAKDVDTAWQAMPDAFHQALLGGWYADRYSERHALLEAWKIAGETPRRRGYDFEASIAMARALISEELERKGVVRRFRMGMRIRIALGLPELPTGGLDNIVSLAAA